MTYVRSLAPSTARSVQRRIGPDAIFQRVAASATPQVEEPPEQLIPDWQYWTEDSTQTPLPYGAYDAASARAIQGHVDTHGPIQPPTINPVEFAQQFAKDSLEGAGGFLVNTSPPGTLQYDLGQWAQRGAAAIPGTEPPSMVSASGLSTAPGSATDVLGDATAKIASLFEEEAGLLSQPFQGPFMEEAVPTEMTQQYLEVMSSYANQVAELMAAKEQALAEGDAEIARQYDAQIAKVQEQMAATKKAMTDVTAAYEARAQAVAPAFEQAIAERVNQGEDLRALNAAAQEEVQAAFEGEAEELGKTLDLIGAEDPALQTAALVKVGEFQAYAEEALEADLNNQAGLVHQASKLARAVAKAAYAHDQKQMEHAEEKIQAELKVKLDKLADQKRDLEQAKADARAKFRSQIEKEFGDIQFQMDPWQAWEGFYGAMAEEWGWNFEEAADARAYFDQLYESGIRTRSDAKEAIVYDAMDHNASLVMSYLGLQGGLEEMLTMIAQGGFAGDDAYIDLGITDEATAINLLGSQGGFLNAPGLSVLKQAVGDEWWHVSDANAQEQLNVWSAWETHVREYERTMADLQSQLDYLRSTPGAAANFTQADMQLVRGADGDTGYLHPVAAESFAVMMRDAAADGVLLSFDSAYRSYELQYKAWKHFIATGRNLAGNVVPNIAHPDNSNHPKGLALDFSLGSGVHDWLKENAWKYGWTPISSEAWHWEFTGAVSVVSDVITGQDPNRNYPV